MDFTPQSTGEVPMEVRVKCVQLTGNGLKFSFLTIDRIAVHRGSENQVSLFAQFHVIILFFRFVFHAAWDHRHAIGRSFRYNPRDGMVMMFDDEAKIPRDLRQRCRRGRGERALSARGRCRTRPSNTGKDR